MKDVNKDTAQWAGDTEASLGQFDLEKIDGVLVN